MRHTGVLLLFWVLFVHLTGIWLFSRGFLLTRFALHQLNSCKPTEDDCTLPPAYKRAILIVIDALRFDFIAPDPPVPTSQYHHHVLRTPVELSQTQPDRSVIFNAFADPPTTSVQRMKGITTGSLPTFIEMGYNFGVPAISEDSLIHQLRSTDKRVSILQFTTIDDSCVKLVSRKLALVGDASWDEAFPGSFDPNMTFAFKAFSLLDLHSVDKRATGALFPLLRQHNKSWDFLVAHFLGVDHIGHQLGPNTPVMRSKLEQMDRVINDVVDLLDDDTLLVLLGDHGMDKKGGHGGDGELETSAGLWFYSKSRPLVDLNANIPSSLLATRTFTGATIPHRSVQQIDVLSTLSLLLGLPIPFNNLGSIIPELFWEGHLNTSDAFERASRINGVQIKRYLDTYRSSPLGWELDSTWDGIEIAWEDALVEEISMYTFTRRALEICRAMWARFDMVLIVMGLTVLSVGAFSTFTLYSSLAIADVKPGLGFVGGIVVRWSMVGGILGLVIALIAQAATKGMDWSFFGFILFGGALASSLRVVVATCPFRTTKRIKWTSTPIILLLHMLVLTSSDHTSWEDRIILCLLLTSLLPFIRVGFTSRTPRIRKQMLKHSIIFSICVRLIATSTVCREEQEPYCQITFFSGSTGTAPGIIFATVLPLSASLPWIIGRYGILNTTIPHSKTTDLLRPIFPAVLTISSIVWVLEWIESIQFFDASWSAPIQSLRLLLAWSTVGSILVILISPFQKSPSLLIRVWSPVHHNNSVNSKDLETSSPLHNPNIYNLYFISWLAMFSLVFLTSQLTGQVILSLSTISLLSFLKIVDATRHARASDSGSHTDNNNNQVSKQIRFSEVTPLALLALLAFYGTGHQATIPSIQWKSAFLLTPSISYPISPLLVIINSFGPIFVFALAAPLLVMDSFKGKGTGTANPRRGILVMGSQQHQPDPDSNSDESPSMASIPESSLAAILGMSLYYGCLLLSSALSAAVFKRHLMVWPVFAPRFMLAASSMIVVDLAGIIGCCVWNICSWIFMSRQAFVEIKSNN